MRQALECCHGGVQGFYRHDSHETGNPDAVRGVPPPAARRGSVPVVYFLAGLTCTEETATIRAGAQAHASRLGLALVMPDTSPRGASIPGEDDDRDFGTGARFSPGAPCPGTGRLIPTHEGGGQEYGGIPRA